MGLFIAKYDLAPTDSASRIKVTLYIPSHRTLYTLLGVTEGRDVLFLFFLLTLTAKFSNRPFKKKKKKKNKEGAL